MKKKKTSSPSTFIMDDINKKTVRKYKRKNKSYYPVSVPEHVMLKFLDRTRVKHPKVIKKRFRYFEEEYIDGITINDISIMESNEDFHKIYVRLDYTVTSGFKTITDSIITQL